MKYSKKQKSFALKVALFATGVSGIVAEYILSTLASYFIGNAILQFTLIVSIMLFAMGLGSRLSRMLTKNVVLLFIVTELILSVFISFSAILSYLAYGLTGHSWLIIYLFSILIGVLIGLEIPLATRINDSYEELRLNIANILEKDYFGSLVGGLFFAFVGLPYLGLTYTPFVLGFLNLSVSFWLFIVLRDALKEKTRKVLMFVYAVVTTVFLIGVFYANPIVKYGEQVKYKDKIVFTKQTKFQKVVVTEWKGWNSLYINGNQQLSSFDEYMYHEPMAHLPLELAPSKSNVLILGGGDGCLAREILKHEEVKSITLVDLDPVILDLGKKNPIFTKLNKNALNNPKVKMVSEDAFNFLEENTVSYDVIFVDLPDPNNIDLNKLYTKEFYYLCRSNLTDGGLMITQSGSPYYATKAFYCIEKTMREAKLHTLPLHNQILTLGEWGWIIGSKNKISKKQLEEVDFLKISDLKWLNKDAINLLTSFGRPLVDTTGLKVNTIFKPKLYTYYKAGNWDLY